MVEALHDSGVTGQVLDTLPEAIMVPLREAIVDCQAQPPVSWGKHLLSLVDREDVNMSLLPKYLRKSNRAPLLVRSLTFSWISKVLTSVRLQHM
jgi:anaphase-promoting complex subunit 1